MRYEVTFKMSDYETVTEIVVGAKSPPRDNLDWVVREAASQAGINISEARKITIEPLPFTYKVELTEEERAAVLARLASLTAPAADRARAKIRDAERE